MARPCLYAALTAAALAVAQAASPIVLDGMTALHRYDGHGALSAGASSRLLLDYPEPQRSEVLDYLFKPNFGASLHLLKVEIGGDTQSTDGTEPSPEHSPSDGYDCTRGYEAWLVAEARKRNPDILLYVLSWGVPAWVGNGSYFSADNIEYQTAFAACLRDKLDAAPQYIGIWNERSWGTTDYVVSLRHSLDVAGLNDTRIALPDGWDAKGVAAAAAANATFADAIDVVGVHYPCHSPCPAVGEVGKAYWASEDYSTVADWAGAGCWGRSLVQNYVWNNQTSTIAWSLIWSVYPSLPYFGNGLMYAYWPWSGYYTVNSPVWTSAHWTQFTQPGWRFLTVSGGGSGFLPGGGAYTTLVPANGTSDFTLILETLQGDCLRCKGGPTTAQNVTFKLQGGLPGAGTQLQVWRTTDAAPFVRDESDIVVAADGTFSVFIDADSMVTVSTITTATHGGFPDSPIPANTPFPLPYSDSLTSAAPGSADGYPYDALARYFSDQAGSFAVRNGSLQQLVAVDPGANGWVPNSDPITIIGDSNWTDITVAVTVAFSSAAPTAAVAGAPLQEARARVDARGDNRRSLHGHAAESSTDGSASLSAATSGTPPAVVAPCLSSIPATQQWTWDVPATGYLSNNPTTRAADQLCLNSNGCGDELIYYQCVTSGGTCCGADCYEGLQFSLDASTGRLTSPLLPGLCATAQGNGTVVMAACSGVNQSWAYAAATKQVQLTLPAPAAPLCLTAPLALSVYAQVCARVGPGNWNGHIAPPGFCLLVQDSGAWMVRAGSSTLGTGVLGGNWDCAAPNALSISVVGPGSGTGETLTVTARVSNATVATIGVPAGSAGSGYLAGMAAIGSGYHAAAFNDFSVQQA